MDVKKWMDNNTWSLKGKTVAITGSTGGLGREICTYLASLGASLVLLDRNAVASEQHKNSILARFTGIEVDRISVDLEDIASVKKATDELKTKDVDIFIHNAGAYSIPRHICNTGYDNVFQINFASPYYMIRELLPILDKKGGKVIAVGSIAHNYSSVDKSDVDFKTRKSSSKVYGNAKRYLMFSLSELFRSESNVKLSLAHPGITFTNITAHYPKLIFAIIKHPMKIIFMRPKKAALCIVKAVFDSTRYDEWIGPCCFDIWGMPKKKKLQTASEGERNYIANKAQEIYGKLRTH